MKKIIALAVASAFVAPVALAEVTIYGSMRPNVEYTQVSGSNSANNLTKVQLIDNSSRIGFKGSDKLDSGVKLYWQVENRVRLGTNNSAGTTDGFTSRDSFVGLEGKLGKIQAGKISDLTDDFNSDYAPALASWNTATTDMRNFILRDTARIANVVQYISPTMSGVRARAQYDFGRKDSSSADAKGYEAELGYTHKMFSVAALYKRNNDTTATGDGSYATSSGTSLVSNGSKYEKMVAAANVKPVKGLDISFEWTRQELRDSVTATNSYKQDAYGVGVGYTAGKHGIALQYALLKDKKNATTTADTGANAYAVQYKYALSKQTILLATANYVDNDVNSNVDMTGSTTLANGATTKAVSVGLRHDF